MSSVTTHKLADFATILSGYAFDSGCFGETGEIPIIRIRDVVRGYSNTFYTGDFSSNFVINNGDLLVGMDGDFNTAIWQGGIAVLNQRVCKIIPNQKIIDQTYLYYLLPKELKKIWDETSFVTVKHLSVKALQTIEVPLPPLPEQKRIAAILDKADSIRRKRQEGVRLTDELLRSVFLDMFGDPVTNPKGWVCKSLDAICTKITDGEHLNPLFVDDGFPLVMANNVRSEGVNFDGVKYVSKIDFEKFTKKCKPLKNDILVVSRGATIGRCTVVDTERPFCLMGSTILIKTDNGMILPAYLNSLLQHPAFQAKLYKTSSSSAQQAIYLSHIKELSVPIPPIKEQEKFSELVLKGKKALDILSRAVIQSDDLFNSFLQRAFKGKVLNATLL